MADALVQLLASNLMEEASKYGVDFPPMAAKKVAQTMAAEARLGAKDEVEHPQLAGSIEQVVADSDVPITITPAYHPNDQINWVNLSAAASADASWITSITAKYGKNFMVMVSGEPGLYDGQITTKVKPVQQVKDLGAYELTLTKQPQLIVQDVITQLMSQLHSDVKAAGMFLATDITVNKEHLLDPSALRISVQAWAGYPIAPLSTTN